MTNYDIDEIERKERYERFDHAVNCLDISPVTMLAFERIAEKKDVSLSENINNSLKHLSDVVVLSISFFL